MTKYKGWLNVWENGVYVVTVCVVEIAVSAVDLIFNEAKLQKCGNRITILDINTVSQLFQCRHDHDHV